MAAVVRAVMRRAPGAAEAAAQLEAAGGTARAAWLDLPPAVAGAQIMLTQLDRLLAHEAGARAGADPEDVHRMRVAARRLRVAARVFGKAIQKASGVCVPLAALREVAQALGAVRDLDVFIAALRERAALAGPPDAEALERLVADRLREREPVRAGLLAALDGEAMATLRSTFRASLAALAGAAAADTAGGRGRRGRKRPVRRLARRAVARSLRALRQSGASLAAPTAGDLHRMRIRAKRFRYTCEFFAPAGGEALAQSAALATALQDALGAVHDGEVATAALLADVERVAADPAHAGDAAALARLIAAYRAERDAALGRFRALWRTLRKRRVPLAETASPRGVVAPIGEPFGAGEPQAGNAGPGARVSGRSALAGDGHVGAIDLGGTKILAAIVGPGGEIVSRAKKSTGRDHAPAAVIDRMAACVREAAGAAGVPAETLHGVGVGAPGPIEPGTGVVRVAPNLSWENVPLKAELERRLGVPVAVDNDVRVAVLAEHVAGAGRGARHMVGIWPGTGVGGGVVIDGQLYRGAADLAGEIGHITVKAGGPRCGCGGRGHLEALASRTAIVRYIVRAARRGARTELTKIVGKDLAQTTSGDLAKAWARGDRLVGKALDRAAQYLALGIASAANLLNPELVVLGGGVIEGLGDRFVERISDEVRTLPLHASTAPLRLVRSQFGDDAGIAGAAILARRLVRV